MRNCATSLGACPACSSEAARVARREANCRVTRALRPCYEQMREALPRSDAAAMDETPAKESNRKAWLWTGVTKHFTLFHIAGSREASVAKELLGEDYSGIVTSDRYSGYDWIGKQQLCWAHLLRARPGGCAGEKYTYFQYTVNKHIWGVLPVASR